MFVGYLGFFILLIAGGFIYWDIQFMGSMYLDRVTERYAEGILGADITFMRSIIEYLPLLLLLFAFAFLLVYSQQSKIEGYYYG